VELVITKLDDGQVRVADVGPTGAVVVHEWVRKAILLLFRLRGLEKSEVGPFEYLDRLELKRDYERRGVRVVPGASARRGASSAAGHLDASYVNIGAWVGRTRWSTRGRPWQLRPDRGERAPFRWRRNRWRPRTSQRLPVVIEDDAFIGSRCMSRKARASARIRTRCGTALGPSIPVIDAARRRGVARPRARLLRGVSANRKRVLMAESSICRAYSSFVA